MSVALPLLLLSLLMGAIGLCTFLWSIRNRQYQDLEGDAERILHDDQEAASD